MADNSVKELFTGMLRESGMPVTEAEMQAEWDRLNVDSGSLISNESSYSPFWRLISSIVTKPAQWLVELLVTHALPNSFLRYASGKWLDVYAWGVDLTRKEKAYAIGKVEFTRASAVGELVIPAGIFIETPPLNGKVYRVKTLAETIIPQGELALLVDVQAESAGEAYNLGAGYFSILSSPVPGIISVSNPAGWLITPGADEETDEALRLRCRNQFAAVGQFHHDAAYKALIGEFSGIRLDYLFFEKEGPRGPGTANCHIMIESGVPPQELVDSVNNYVRTSGNHGHGDDLLAMPVRTKGIDLVATAYPVFEAGPERQEALQQAVEDRIRCAFRENTAFNVSKVYPLARFSFSQLDRELHMQLPDLRSVEFSCGDIVALLELPMLASLQVKLGEGV